MVFVPGAPNTIKSRQVSGSLKCKNIIIYMRRRGVYESYT